MTDPWWIVCSDNFSYEYYGLNGPFPTQDEANAAAEARRKEIAETQAGTLKDTVRVSRQSEINPQLFAELRYVQVLVEVEPA